MNKFIKATQIFFFMLLISTINSCDLFNTSINLTGRYYYQHNKFGKSICYKVDDSGDCIVLIDVDSGRIGFDDNYIFVQRGEQEYFIIPIYKTMNYFPEKGILGPLNLNDFNAQKRRLNIKVNFTLVVN